MQTDINKSFDQLNSKYTVECGGGGDCFIWSAMYTLNPNKIPNPEDEKDIKDMLELRKNLQETYNNLLDSNLKNEDAWYLRKYDGLIKRKEWIQI